MQTTGAFQLVVNQCSSARARTPVQGSRSVHELLYLAAVRDDSCQQDHRQGRVDINLTCDLRVLPKYFGDHGLLSPVEFQTLELLSSVPESTTALDHVPGYLT
jgi:hypothetical protein